MSTTTAARVIDIFDGGTVAATTIDGVLHWTRRSPQGEITMTGTAASELDLCNIIFAW